VSRVFANTVLVIDYEGAHEEPCKQYLRVKSISFGAEIEVIACVCPSLILLYRLGLSLIKSERREISKSMLLLSTLKLLLLTLICVIAFRSVCGFLDAKAPFHRTPRHQ
jgi:hypothetical protein